MDSYYSFNSYCKEKLKNKAEIERKDKILNDAKARMKSETIQDFKYAIKAPAAQIISTSFSMP